MKKFVMMSAVLGMAMTAAAAQERTGPVKYEIGKYEVWTLTENEGRGDKSILIDAPQEVLERYAPQGTFPNAVCAFLIKGGDKVWLVDTGFGRHIFEDMASVGVAPGDVDHVLLTHMHGDHIGGMLREGRAAFPNADVTVSRREYDYWSSEDEMNKLPANRRGNFTSARKVFEVYGDRIKIVDPLPADALGGRLKEGFSPIAAYGHTPGHIMYLLKSGRNELLIWGDLTHALAVQMPHPEISVTYDVDPEMARESRTEVFSLLGADFDNKNTVSDKSLKVLGMKVVGMHVPYERPGVVGKDPYGEGYFFLPLTEK